MIQSLISCENRQINPKAHILVLTDDPLLHQGHVYQFTSSLALGVPYRTLFSGYDYLDILEVISQQLPDMIIVEVSTMDQLKQIQKLEDAGLLPVTVVVCSNEFKQIHKIKIEGITSIVEYVNVSSLKEGNQQLTESIQNALSLCVSYQMKLISTRTMTIKDKTSS